MQVYAGQDHAEHSIVYRCKKLKRASKDISRSTIPPGRDHNAVGVLGDGLAIGQGHQRRGIHDDDVVMLTQRFEYRAQSAGERKLVHGGSVLCQRGWQDRKVRRLLDKNRLV